MQIKRRDEPIARYFTEYHNIPKVALEFDVKLGSLFAKVIVFHNPRLLKKCWLDTLNIEIGAGIVLAAVNGLYYEVIGAEMGESYLSVDPRYFCIIGLTLKNLTMEAITHESVHAAFCFVKRKSRSPWDLLAKDNDEESIAYPAGLIATRINRAIYKHGLYV